MATPLPVDVVYAATSGVTVRATVLSANHLQLKHNRRASKLRGGGARTAAYEVPGSNDTRQIFSGALWSMKAVVAPDLESQRLMSKKVVAIKPLHWGSRSGELATAIGTAMHAPRSLFGSVCEADTFANVPGKLGGINHAGRKMPGADRLRTQLPLPPSADMEIPAIEVETKATRNATANRQYDLVVTKFKLNHPALSRDVCEEVWSRHTQDGPIPDHAKEVTFFGNRLGAAGPTGQQKMLTGVLTASMVNPDGLTSHWTLDGGSGKPFNVDVRQKHQQGSISITENVPFEATVGYLEALAGVNHFVCAVLPSVRKWFAVHTTEMTSLHMNNCLGLESVMQLMVPTAPFEPSFAHWDEDVRRLFLDLTRPGRLWIRAQLDVNKDVVLTPETHPELLQLQQAVSSSSSSLDAFEMCVHLTYNGAQVEMDNGENLASHRELLDAVSALLRDGKTRIRCGEWRTLDAEDHLPPALKQRFATVFCKVSAHYWVQVDRSAFVFDWSLNPTRLRDVQHLLYMSARMDPGWHSWAEHLAPCREKLRELLHRAVGSSATAQQPVYGGDHGTELLVNQVWIRDLENLEVPACTNVTLVTQDNWTATWTDRKPFKILLVDPSLVKIPLPDQGLQMTPKYVGSQNSTVAKSLYHAVFGMYVCLQSLFDKNMDAMNRMEEQLKQPTRIQIGDPEFTNWQWLKPGRKLDLLSQVGPFGHSAINVSGKPELRTVGIGGGAVCPDQLCKARGALLGANYVAPNLIKLMCKGSSRLVPEALVVQSGSQPTLQLRRLVRQQILEDSSFPPEPDAQEKEVLKALGDLTGRVNPKVDFMYTPHVTFSKSDGSAQPAGVALLRISEREMSDIDDRVYKFLRRLQNGSAEGFCISVPNASYYKQLRHMPSVLAAGESSVQLSGVQQHTVRGGLHPSASDFCYSMQIMSAAIHHIQTTWRCHHHLVCINDVPFVKSDSQKEPRKRSKIPSPAGNAAKKVQKRSEDAVQRMRRPASIVNQVVHLGGSASVGGAPPVTALEDMPASSSADETSEQWTSDQQVALVQRISTERRSAALDGFRAAMMAEGWQHDAAQHDDDEGRQQDAAQHDDDDEGWQQDAAQHDDDDDEEEEDALDFLRADFDDDDVWGWGA